MIFSCFQKKRSFFFIYLLIFLQISKLIIQFLAEKIITPVNIAINVKYKEKIENLVGLNNKEGEESPKNTRDANLQELVSIEDILYTETSSFENIRESHKLNEKIYKSLLKSILDLVCVNLGESFTEDKDRKIAKKKINLIYKSHSKEEKPKFNGIINLRVPLSKELHIDHSSFMSTEYYDGTEFLSRRKTTPGFLIFNEFFNFSNKK